MLVPLAIDLVVLVDPGLEPLEEPGKRSPKCQQERDLDHSIFLPWTYSSLCVISRAQGTRMAIATAIGHT